MSGESTPADDACAYRAVAELRDGSPVCIRSISPQDREGLNEHFHTLSPHSIYMRFFGPKKSLTPEELSYYTEMDGSERVGLVATLPGSDDIVGVGRYFRLRGEDERHRAEVAFAVSDKQQRRGIASLLLAHLARIGRRHGITEFVAEVLGGNLDMMEVFARSGFGIHRSIDGGVYHVTIPIGEADSEP